MHCMKPKHFSTKNRTHNCSQTLSKKNSQSGLGLVEVLLAFGISIIIITAIVSLSTFVLRTSSSSSRMMQGTRLMSRELELVRATRDKYVNQDGISWASFMSVISPCKAIETNGTACGSHACTINIQTLEVTNVAGSSDSITYCFGSRPVVVGGQTATDKVDIITVATWTVGGQRKYVHGYTRLARWED